MIRIEKRADVGQLAVELPAATRVFVDNGIEFCCRGPRSLSVACRESQADPDAVLAEIATACLEQYAMQPADESPGALVDFISDRYLRPLSERLSVIDSLVEKTIRMHGIGTYATREGVRTVFANLSSRLQEHKRKKEDWLFPAIVEGGGRSVKPSLRAMREAHARLTQHLEILYRLTSGFAVTEHMCVTEKALMASLQELVGDLAAQFHMEQNVLYPRVIEAS